MDKTKTLTADGFMAGVEDAAAQGADFEMVATMMQFAFALRAAEQMADAIDAAEDSRYSMTPAGKAAWEFRKAMRGEL